MIADMPAPSKYSRRHPEPKKRRPSTVTVPEGVCPHVKLLFAEMRRLNITYQEVEDRSGVQRPALKSWRHRTNPTLTSMEAALAVVGYQFVPLPTEMALPPEIVAELRPIAERIGLEVPAAIQLAAEIAYRDKHLADLKAST
ncbi:hypothetical protein [Methylobacterium gregans]|uniref:hypothetical protein n=1 Tax=Methylobacterium gregans TaxID=374424 RepID=UPI001EE32DB1|nr:hypothetical protein [Methylobacterium gregans]MDQ0523792.1 hypothetical protein [Methylobacterium gregans]GLS54765.1 hypothetical protein GCM10007886_29490 [Methylobacterium gregans]